MMDDIGFILDNTDSFASLMATVQNMKLYSAYVFNQMDVSQTIIVHLMCYLLLFTCFKKLRAV